MLRQINITDLIHQGNDKPNYIKINKRKHKYFCPICNDVKEFKRDSYLGVRKCTSCGISDRDFYVKRCNSLELLYKRK